MNCLLEFFYFLYNRRLSFIYTYMICFIFSCLEIRSSSISMHYSILYCFLIHSFIHSYALSISLLFIISLSLSQTNWIDLCFSCLFDLLIFLWTLICIESRLFIWLLPIHYVIWCQMCVCVCVFIDLRENC